jgi:monolysocardiolipin acyltransferase
MAAPDAPDQPSMLWRTGSSIITGATGFLCRTFLVGLNRLELKGYDKFMRLLDERADVNGRTKGLITGVYPSFCLAKTSTLTASSFKPY